MEKGTSIRENYSRYGTVDNLITGVDNMLVNSAPLIAKIKAITSTGNTIKRCKMILFEKDAMKEINEVRASTMENLMSLKTVRDLLAEIWKRPQTDPARWMKIGDVMIEYSKITGKPPSVYIKR